MKRIVSSLQMRAQTPGRNLISFRDSLARRIPPFIPPYVVPKANIEKHNELEKKKWEEPARSNPEEYEKLKAEQLKFGQFVAGIMHSIYEETPRILAK
jgi:hypothetical protein